MTGQGNEESATDASVGRRRVAGSPEGTPKRNREADSRTKPTQPADRGFASERKSEFEWAYRWEDLLNSIVGEAISPSLCDRIVSEIEVALASDGDQPLVFVRGELGIGKSTLKHMLIDRLMELASHIEIEDVRNRLTLCRVIEAEDLETPEAFARRINDEASDYPVIALARPATFDAAASSLQYSPRATATMLPFRSNTQLFYSCIATVSDRAGVSQSSGLRDLCSRLPEFLSTPFYFGVLAQMSASSEQPDLSSRTPLDLFDISIQSSFKGTGMQALLEVAVRPTNATSRPVARTVQGVISEEGFIHDGYRNLILAISASQGMITIDQLAACSNAVDAFRLVLDHAEQANQERVHELNDALADFAIRLEGRSHIPYLIYLQALAARAVSRFDGGVAEGVVRQRCVTLMMEREAADTKGERAEVLDEVESPELWWDVSDALSLLGDARLEQALTSGSDVDEYFTWIDRRFAEIGSSEIPERSDMAKPVLPYSKQEVVIGPLWVANYLVTNEQFQQYWRDPRKDEYFVGAGRQWARREPALVAAIEDSFRVTATRCFWKELQETEATQVRGRKSVLDIARERALRIGRVALWDRAQSDDRLCARGKPVVGVTWWEAIAFCKWWEDNILPTSGLPTGASVTLLTDWEWEALRKIFYDIDATPIAREKVDSRTFPAHLRSARTGGGARPRVLQSLHVGLFPTPSGEGPRDMIGNVWEWTRSMVLGQITEANVEDQVFGATAWEDGDAKREREAGDPERDRTDVLNDLSYRTVRGASFFSIDEEAAWNSAYRLCDPPYSSYFDLGFRIAVYPPVD